MRKLGSDVAENDLNVRDTSIPGLLIIALVVRGDERGWFKENWQRAKMTELGLPDFSPVQHSVALNSSAGVTRGFHAEPWDKLVSVAAGRIFGAWVDLREGNTFGECVTLEIGPETAVFVPRGVANGYQALADGTVYSYLVNDHWSAEKLGDYGYLNLADETLGVQWPVPLSEAMMSAADATHPRLADVTPCPGRRIVVIGARGQLGRELMKLLPNAMGVDRSTLDLTDGETFNGIDWSQVDTIINAAAFTAVDEAETPAGRRVAWAVNVEGVARLCRIAEQHRITMVHISSDYVFDGMSDDHGEREPLSPLGVYGQTKAAGDALVQQLARHHVVRTSWLIGDGPNFVSTMMELASRGTCPTVVDDQFGRLTFAKDLATGIVHLLESGAAPGVWNLTNSGATQSFADVARDVFALCGRQRDDVVAVSTKQYAAQQSGRTLAPRPRNSTLNLERIQTSGFRPPEAGERLRVFVASHQ